MAEENKAIEKLKSYKELFSKGYCKDCNELCVIDNFPSKDLKNSIDIVLNLIETLQKENEEKTTIIMAGAEKVKQLEKDLKKQEVKENYIPKDKIRELLKRHNIEFGEDTIAMSEQGAFGFMLSIKELLEEE